MSAPARRAVINVAIPGNDVTGAGASEAATGAVPTRRRAGRRRYLVPVVAAAVVLTVSGVIAGVVAWSNGGTGNPDPSGTQPAAADCPVSQSNPPFTPPAARGDKGAFITDVTLPDCSHLSRGETALKVWRFKNVGRVSWVGYSLHRLDMPQQRDQCQTITDIPMPTTRPGQLVDVKTEITAPDRRAFCFVRFKMENAAGKIAFPGSRPVYFQLIVD